jgi:hypothetical protein
MRNRFYKVGGSALLLGALLACGAPNEVVAGGVDFGVNVNIGPPPIVVAEPPAMVMVPDTQVYFVPEAKFDVFFYNGYWWSPRGDRWYRSRAYNGPWRHMDRRFVPRPVCRVPHDYRHAYARERHIPYREWREHHGGGHGGGYGGGERHTGGHAGGHGGGGHHGRAEH